MSVLTTLPRLTRSRWTEPIVTVVGALVLGLGLAAASHPQTASSPVPPPAPVKPGSVVQTAPPPDLRELVARTAGQRVRLTLKSGRHHAAPKGHLYHIHWGDTLWSLAHRFHVPMKDLEEANQMPVPDLVAGKYLVIPELYHVKPGDSLASVAHHLDVPLLMLWHTNRLRHDKLRPGQILVVPYTGRVPHARYAGGTTTFAGSETASTASPPAQPSRGLAALPAALSAQDMLTIAHLVQAEAGDQPFLGQVAVAAVVLNRLRTPGFPKTVDGVVFAPGQFETVTTGTFWNAPGPLAMMAVKAAASGWDPTGGALYFFNPSMPHVAWMNTLPVTATIGDQVFCR